MKPIRVFSVFLTMALAAARTSAQEPKLARLDLAKTLAAQGYESLALTSMNSGYLSTPAKIAGATLHVIVDTGAGTSNLDRERTKAIGFKWWSFNSPPDKHSNASTGYAEVSCVQVGPLKTPRMMLYCNNLDPINRGIGPNGDALLDGVLGADVLAPFSAVIHYGEGKLFLNPRRTEYVTALRPPTVELSRVFGSAEALVVPVRSDAAPVPTLRETPPIVDRFDLAAFLQRQGYERIALTRMKHGTFVVPVTIHGVKVGLLLDTGAPMMVLDGERTKALKIDWVDRPGADPNFTTGIGEIASLEIGSIKIGPMVVGRMQVGAELFREDPMVGVLGGDVLRSYSAVIDYPSASLFLLKGERAIGHEMLPLIPPANR